MILMMIFSGGCFSQGKNGDRKTIDREPYAAGKFYESNPLTLQKDLKTLFSEATNKMFDNVIAIISPHAGYPFSGEIAASAFNQIDPQMHYDHVFVIASSHRVSFRGASVYNRGDYLTPLGKVKVDIDLARKLVEENELFTYRNDAHIYEHSLEVQLPFLQYKLGNDVNMIPIVIGTQRKEECEEIARVLKPFLGRNNLFVISTDFSHYPSYEDAIEVDHKTAGAIESKSVDKLHKVLKGNESMKIQNLATSLCGWSSVYTLLYMIQDEPDYTVHKVNYKNSGDAELYGDKDRVVGYWAMAVTARNSVKEPADKNKKEFELTQKDKMDLLHIARQTLDQYIQDGSMPNINADRLSSECHAPCGAFVTLLKAGKLRGCIGRFEPGEPLYKVVQDMAVSASTKDYRFPSVSPEELDDIEIEISVLTPMEKISSIEDIEMGKHGIYITDGRSSGTFLPQVATQTGWSKEEFLGHCSKDKARIGWDGWKNADIYIYEALVFGEHK